jgi:asparagine synthase (glutamine-hydrolysing)
MCGLVAIFNYGRSISFVAQEELVAICEAIAGRGPDGEGRWISVDSRVGLGHRRLSLLDLSEAGAQPMTNEDGSLRIVFNGEIYNDRELRQSFENSGFRFRSKSNTEVLLHLYAQRDAEMVHALRGIYAFAIWDATQARSLPPQNDR